MIGSIDVTARGPLSAIVAAALMIAGARATADPPAAADLRYREGKQAFTAGDFAEAAARFEEAFKLSADPTHLFNLAQAQRLAGDCDAARASYREYLARVPEAPNRADVEEKLAALEDCARPAPTPVEPKPAPAPAPVEAAAGTSSPVALAPPPDERDPGGEPDARHGYGGLWVAGGGVVSLAVGLVAWRSARQKQDALVDLTIDGDASSPIRPGSEAEATELKDQMRLRETIAMATVPLGLGLVAGGLIYHVVQVRKARRARAHAAVQVGVAPVAGGGAMLVLGRSDL